MIKGYKYRLDPTPEQIVQMEKTFGCCRYVYNWALDLKIKTYQSEKRSMSAVDLCKQLTLLKKMRTITGLMKYLMSACNNLFAVWIVPSPNSLENIPVSQNSNPNIETKTFLRMSILLSLILKTTELRFLSLVG